MARDLTAGMVTEVTADNLAPVVLVKIEFDSGDLNLWTGIGDLTFGGDTYTGAGDLLSFGPMSETQGLQAAGWSGQLSGIPSALISTALSEDYMGRPMTVWLGAINSSGALISDPAIIFAGLIDTMPIEDAGETATIGVSAENRLIRLEKPNVRRYTPEDQAVEYSGDLGFSFVTLLNDGREIVWGRT